MNGDGNKDDEVKGMEVMNNILYFVTVGRGSGSFDDATTSAYYCNDFHFIWSNNYSSVNGDINIAGMQCTEISGDIMLAGIQGNFTSGTSDYLALSYKASDGTQNWAKTISRGSGYDNIATAFALNAYGDLLITGSTNLAGAAVDMFTVEYDVAGNLLWSKVFNDAVNGDDYPTAIGADVNGNFFIGGTSAQPASLFAGKSLSQGKNNQDFTVLKYSSKFICAVPENLYSDSIFSYQWRVKTICSNNPAVSSDYSLNKSFTTLASAFAVSLFNNDDEALADGQTGLQLFPNPASQKVNLQLNNLSETNLQVKIYDLSGRELKNFRFTTINKTFNRQIDVSTLAPGSYMVVMMGSKQKWSQVLIKP